MIEIVWLRKPKVFTNKCFKKKFAIPSLKCLFVLYMDSSSLLKLMYFVHHFSSYFNDFIIIILESLTTIFNKWIVSRSTSTV